MTILSGRQIYEMGMVSGYEDLTEQIQPSSFDLRLGNEFICYDKDNILDVQEPPIYKKFTADTVLLVPIGFELKNGKGYMKKKYNIDKIIEGGLLGTTIETINIPSGFAAQYQGRSSLGRLFLHSHITAGWIDSGFKGQITLELIASDKPVLLKSGMRIGQLIVHRMDKEPDKLYEGKYQNQKGVVVSKCSEDFIKVDVKKIKKMYILEGKSLLEIKRETGLDINEILAIFTKEGIDINEIDQKNPLNKLLYDLKD